MQEGYEVLRYSRALISNFLVVCVASASSAISRLTCRAENRRRTLLGACPHGQMFRPGGPPLTKRRKREGRPEKSKFAERQKKKGKEKKKEGNTGQRQNIRAARERGLVLWPGVFCIRPLQVVQSRQRRGWTVCDRMDLVPGARERSKAEMNENDQRSTRPVFVPFPPCFIFSPFFSSLDSPCLLAGRLPHLSKCLYCASSCRLSFLSPGPFFPIKNGGRKGPTTNKKDSFDFSASLLSLCIFVSFRFVFLYFLSGQPAWGRIDGLFSAAPVHV